MSPTWCLVSSLFPPPSPSSCPTPPLSCPTHMPPPSLCSCLRPAAGLPHGQHVHSPCVNTGHTGGCAVVVHTGPAPHPGVFLCSIKQFSMLSNPSVGAGCEGDPILRLLEEDGHRDQVSPVQLQGHVPAGPGLHGHLHLWTQHERKSLSGQACDPHTPL